MPAGYVPSGTITATSPQNFQDSFIVPFYTNLTATAGLLWDVDPYGGGTDDYTTALPYRLIAAAWDDGA